MICTLRKKDLYETGPWKRTGIGPFSKMTREGGLEYVLQKGQETVGQITVPFDGVQGIKYQQVLWSDGKRMQLHHFSLKEMHTAGRKCDYPCFEYTFETGEHGTVGQTNVKLTGNHTYLSTDGRWIKFDGNYCYHYIEQDGIRYCLYEVGFGKRAVYYCIYSDDILIAMVSLNMTVHNGQNIYEIYAEDSVELPLILILILLKDWYTAWDYDKNRRFTAYHYEYTEYRCLNTWQMALKEKYDPDFIEKIVALENSKR